MQFAGIRIIVQWGIPILVRSDESKKWHSRAGIDGDVRKRHRIFDINECNYVRVLSLGFRAIPRSPDLTE